MDELIYSPIKARIFLSKIGQIEKALVDIIRSQPVTKSTKEKVSEIDDLLRFCERDGSEIELANIILEGLKSPKEIESEDFVNLIEIIYQCKSELEDYINEAFEEQLIQNIVPETKYKEYLSALKNYAEEKFTLDKTLKKNETKNIIYASPGNYITSLYKQMYKKFGSKGVTYTTIWKYVNELVNENEIITIGGPQGNLRYCFPNPARIKDRSDYYGKYFGVVGKIKKQVTESFESTGHNKRYYKFYIINTLVIPEILMAVGYTSPPLSNGSNVQIRTYGDLEPFEYLKRNEGYIPKNGLSEIDVLFARRVTNIVDGKEVAIWTDPKTALLSQPPSLI